MSNPRDNDLVTVEVGQRVYSDLYGGCAGIVYEVHNPQGRVKLRCVAGGVLKRSWAEFDVVLDDGTTLLSLPEPIVRGAQWRIEREVASAGEIAAALRHAATIKADRSARLAGAQQHRHLRQGDDKYSGTLAAENLRTELKRSFPRSRFTVTMTRFGSLTIQWSGGPTEKRVEALCQRYRTGHFNYRDGLYEITIEAWHEVFGGAEQISLQRAAPQPRERWARAAKPAPPR